MDIPGCFASRWYCCPSDLCEKIIRPSNLPVGRLFSLAGLFDCKHVHPCTPKKDIKNPYGHGNDLNFAKA
eukprot:231965-Amphidinium_carterae.1